MSAQAEKGISFMPEMVTAILEGRKTQTRRVVKFEAPHLINNITFREDGWYYDTGNHCYFKIKCRYQVGMRLWVKETWAEMSDCCEYVVGAPVYKASWPPTIEERHDAGLLDPPKKWRSPRFMPKRTARIWLEVEAIRFERVQDITNKDAKAEGVKASESVNMKDRTPCYTLPFQILWIKLYGFDNPKAWENNPFVEVVTFRKVV